MTIASTVKQRTIPGGKIFFDAFDADGNKTGERYLGLTPGFTLTLASESIQSYSSESGLKELDDETLISVTRTGKITCRQISQENLSLFLVGAASVQTQAGATVTGEVHHVVPDRYYQLGASVANPSGVRNVSAVTITGATSGEYTVDAAAGRIYVHSDATVDPVAGEDWTVGYTVAAATRERITTGQLANVSGALRFISYPAKGTPMDLYAPSVNLAPSGDLVLKADDPAYAELSWDVAFNVGPNGEPALVIDGRAT